MNKEESEDVESAYGSEISSNPNLLLKKDAFTMRGFPLKTPKLHQWLRYILREAMIVELAIFITLICLIISCGRIESQNMETQEMISNLQSQFDSFQKEATGEDFVKTKKQEIEEIIKKEFEKMKEVSEEYLKGVRIQSEEVLKEIRLKSVEQLEPSIINSPKKIEKTDVPPIIPTVSTHPTLKRYNAASLIKGASVDSSLSSSSSLSNTSFFDFDQSSLVLVDRPVPPVNKAWCTYEKEPVLTVNLAEYIMPTAVSYQHSKWNGTIPDDAPKEYSVEACLDNYCMNRQTLFSNCEYNSYGHQEQLCSASTHSIVSPVKKLQFRFQKNHGNTKRTCVSLVRVFSGDVQERKFRSLGDTTTCLDWKHTYQNNPLQYKYKPFKTCDYLYSKGCCQECPECCEECQIRDFDADVIFPFVIVTVPLIIFPSAVFFCYSLLLKIFAFVKTILLVK